MIDETLPPPTWGDMRSDGGMLIDEPHQKVGIYAGNDGHVVIVHEDVVDRGPKYVVIEPSLVPALIGALIKAQGSAAVRAAAIEAEIGAYLAAEP